MKKIKEYLNKRKNIKFVKNIDLPKFSYKIHGDLLSVYIKNETIQFDIKARHNFLVSDVVVKLVKKYGYFDKKWIS